MEQNKIAERAWAYYIGDQYQFSNFPTLPKTHPMYKSAQAEIERLFHPYNICQEIVDIFAAALVGKPFSWSLKSRTTKDSDAADPNRDEAQQIITDWFEWQSEVGIDADLGDPIINCIVQMLVRDQGNGSGAGYLRLYEPDLYQKLEAYQKVVMHAPEPGTVTVKRNRQGILYYAEYGYEDGEKEIYELQPDGTTKITDDKTKEERIEDYGGRLPIIEMKGRSLINKAIQRGQDSINKTLTIKDINVEAAGFLERVLLNAMPPGEFVERDDGTKAFKVAPGKLDIGANLVTYVTGIPIGDPDAPEGYTTPDTRYRNPVPVDTFRESMAIDISTIYFQAGLAYLLSSGDGKISGKSRLTLKEDFLVRLRTYEVRIEAAIRKMLTLLIKILEVDYPVLTGYVPVVELNLAVTPLPEERQQNREDFAKGAMSLPSLISANGREVQKELTDIEKYLPLVRRISQAFASTDSGEADSETNADENVEDRLREKAKGNSSSD